MTETHERDALVARLAYEAAVKRLERQELKLNEIRKRTTTLLGAAAIAVSFLANATLTDRSSDLSAFTFVGLAAAAVAGFFSIRILLPARPPKLGSEAAASGDGWKFSPNTSEFISVYYEGDYESEDGRPGRPHSLEETHAGLAAQMAAWHARNDKGLGRLYRWFLWAAVAVGIGMTAWTIDLLFIFERVNGGS